MVERLHGMQKATGSTPVSSTMKTCSKCRTVKSLSEFHKSNRAASGRQAYCKDCDRESRNTHYRNNPDLRRNNMIWTRYKLRPEDLERMLAEQDNRCILCERSFDMVQYHVDHCHRTGRIRGLLCPSCNKSLGWYENRSTAVATYLGD